MKISNMTGAFFSFFELCYYFFLCYEALCKYIFIYVLNRNTIVKILKNIHIYRINDVSKDFSIDTLVKITYWKIDNLLTMNLNQCLYNTDLYIKNEQKNNYPRKPYTTMIILQR